MIAPEQRAYFLHDFSTSYEQIKYDKLNIRKPISELSLTDFHWYLRKRIHLELIVELVLDLIEERWAEIDIYYPTEICQWYDEIIKEIITIQFEFWDTKHLIFLKFCGYIGKSTKRPLLIEESIKQLFLDYKPKEICWTKEDDRNFESELSQGLGMDILGNVIKAGEMLMRLKHAILNNQEVFIEGENNIISTEEQLLTFVRTKYGSYDDTIDDIISGIKHERKITILRNLS
jgi:hypothetical protein